MEDPREDAPQGVEKIPEGVIDALGIESPKRALIFIGCGLVSLAVAGLLPDSPDLTPAARRALFILLFAATLWVTEAIPAYAVGILVIGLQIALLGRPGGVFAETTRDWEQFVVVIGHPLVWLFFGGFVLAAGMARTGLDRQLAAYVLARFGSRPPTLLLGIMAITFTLSMFMSNTATTAMVLAMISPLLASLDADDPFVPGLLLGVAVAANLGGMGSLIGTPPNAIAVGALAELPGGSNVSFLEWMVIGLPLALALAAGAWLFIVRSYPARSASLDFASPEVSTEHSTEESATEAAPAWQKLVVGLTLLLTIGLWLGSQWHTIPTAAVAFIPIVFFTTTGILGTREIRSLNYDILFLLAGGLALGQVVISTGLSTWIVERLPVAALGLAGVALLMSYLTVVLSNFMSNTAAANVLVPIGLSMAVGFEPHIALPIALCASAAMCLPIATPPNALAYATGRCGTREFLRLGLVMGLITPPAAVLWTFLIADWVIAIG
jgi:sodium-dependent dicarboxylate transporter 2/3/5